MILGIDPSSTCTGYCVLDAAGDIDDLGRWHPPAKDDIVDRAATMCFQLQSLLKDVAITDRKIFIEMPGEHQAGGLTRQRGVLKGLALYGWAAGAIWCMAASNCPDVTAVAANVWTRRVPKKKRQARLVAAYPEHKKVLAASGGDAADALGIALWGLGQLKLTRAKGVI